MARHPGAKTAGPTVHVLLRHAECPLAVVPIGSTGATRLLDSASAVSAW